MAAIEERKQKYVALAAMSGLMWGISFVYDLPASLSTHLQAHLYLSDTEYAYTISVLYTVYLLPNILLPFVGGFVAEKYGTARTLVWTLGFIVCGHTMFVLGVKTRSGLLLVIGRIALGLGGEVAGVAASGVVSAWFRNTELSLSLAILTCISRLGGVANLLIIPRVTQSSGVVTASWLSVLALVVCICGVFTILLVGTTPNKAATVLTISPARRTFISQVQHCIISLRNLPGAFWITAINSMAIYGCMIPFKNSASRFLAAAYYRGDLALAGSAVGLPDVISVILVLPFGFLLEFQRFENHSMAIFCASIMTGFAHLLFLFIMSGPILPLCVLGTAYALYAAALWPSIAKIILGVSISASPVQTTLIEQSVLLATTLDESEYSRLAAADVNSDQGNEVLAMEPDNIESYEAASLGRELEAGDDAKTDLVVIGYGIATSLINLSLTVVPILLAGLETWAGYFGIEAVFVGLAGIGAIASMRLMSARL